MKLLGKTLMFISAVFVLILIGLISYSCADTCTAKYPAGKTVTLTATPCPGYRFVKWEGGCTGTFPICTVKMDASKTVKADFEPIPYPEHVRLIDYFNITPQQIRGCRNQKGLIHL